MEEQRFKAAMEMDGKRGIVRLPFDPNKVWGEKEVHHITGSVGPCKVRGPLASEPGSFFLALGPAWMRDYLGPREGEVQVILRPEGPQTDALAEDLRQALDSDPEARAFFDSLATFYRKGYMRWIEGAKRPETRKARIAEMMRLLAAKQKQKP